jgi:hypothetical protein
MNHKHEFSHEHEQDATHQSRQQAGQEFTSAEEMLRFDAKHTAVPPQIADRLRHSASSLPLPRRSWWKNIFGQ